MKKQVRKICDDKIRNDKLHGWSVLPLRKAIKNFAASDFSDLV